MRYLIALVAALAASGCMATFKKIDQALYPPLPHAEASARKGQTYLVEWYAMVTYHQEAAGVREEVDLSHLEVKAESLCGKRYTILHTWPGRVGTVPLHNHGYAHKNPKRWVPGENTSRIQCNG